MTEARKKNERDSVKWAAIAAIVVIPPILLWILSN